jgi:hypothetical protein
MPLRSERRFISLSNVQSGMMIQFNYAKKSGGTGQYVVLVVDPNRRNERATESQLHGFVIDELSDSELLEFFASFRKSISLDYDDRKRSVVEGLNTDEAYETFASSKYVKDRSYRTFNLSGMTQIRQILIGSVDD